jgi:antitoxin MazE
VKARIVRIGNSRGIRIPKSLLEQAGLEDEVELSIDGSHLVVAASRAPRAGWAEAFDETRRHEDDRLLDEPTPTAFDADQWEWRHR